MKYLLLFLLLFSHALVAQTAETLEEYPGLHFYGGDWGPNPKYKFVSKEISEKQIDKLLNELDWIDGFHQVIAVSEPRVSMEVGGSMSPEHGLSAVYRDYRNPDNKIHLVTAYPPENVGQMKQILLFFASGNRDWKNLYGFK